ncbi:BC1881 family protein [Bacillus cereus]|uniref:BC1881 family protein n=1 Tax=Bacillus cereus TaxID=1396 RepID=UPI001B8B9EDA|nr:BC1881 family protein [Bacillus cereus]QUW39288.1 BC1881 family protein [Bacillus cereus]
MINLSEVSKKELSEELERRQSIITVKVEPYEKIEIGGIRVAGPAIVIINQD